MVSGHLGFLDLQPLLAHILQGIAVCGLVLQIFLFPVFFRVNALRQEGFRLFTLAAGSGQGKGREGTKADTGAGCGIGPVVVQQPVFGAVGHDAQLQATAIRQGIYLVPGLGVADFRIGEGFGSTGHFSSTSQRLFSMILLCVLL